MLNPEMTLFINKPNFENSDIFMSCFYLKPGLKSLLILDSEIVQNKLKLVVYEKTVSIDEPNY